MSDLRNSQPRAALNFICALVVTTQFFAVPAALALLKGGGSQGGDDTVLVATYNLENLFDAEHDAGREDWAYLPADHPLKVEGCMTVIERYRQSCLETDWSTTRAALKLSQMQRAVRAMGRLPDILGVQEVENESILREFASGLGYQRVILEEGPDRRGIDVGMVFNETRLRYLSHVSHRISGPGFVEKPTRDILAVFFEPRSSSGDILAVYVNHWPSQANPSARRVEAARQFQAFVARDRKRFQGKRFHVVSLGDFNTVPDDFPHALKAVLLDREHPEQLLDSRAVYERHLSSQGLRSNLPLGSYFYPPRMAWQHLDCIFISPSLQDGEGIELDAASYRVHQMALTTRSFHYRRPGELLEGSVVTGVPNRFNKRAESPEDAGFSDHMPVSVELRF